MIPLTLFACPKPFSDPHIATIQRNAITSWTLLRPRPQIILFGNETGTAEICQEQNLQHVPRVACNEFGTPLLHDIFEKAQQMATYELMCYVNADIILMSNLMRALEQLTYDAHNFLLFGQRWDLELQNAYDFSLQNWEKSLREEAFRNKAPGPLWGLADYFVFRKGTFKDIPPLAIGRTAFDNWFIYKARLLHLPVIDATQAVIVIHQKHDYAHHPDKAEGVWKGVEAQRNQKLVGGADCCSFGLYDATHILTPQGLKRAFGIKYWFRSLDSLPILHSYFSPLKALNPIQKILSSGIRKVMNFTRCER